MNILKRCRMHGLLLLAKILNQLLPPFKQTISNAQMRIAATKMISDAAESNGFTLTQLPPAVREKLIQEALTNHPDTVQREFYLIQAKRKEAGYV